MPHGGPHEAARSSTRVAREREGQSQEIPSVDPGSVRRRSAFEAFQDDVRQTLEGNPIFEALDFVAQNAGPFLGAEPGGASLPVGGFVKQGAKLKSALPPFERLMRVMDMRPVPLKGFSSEAKRVAKETLESGADGLVAPGGRITGRGGLTPAQRLQREVGVPRTRRNRADVIERALSDVSQVEDLNVRLMGFDDPNQARAVRNLLRSPAGSAVLRRGGFDALGSEEAARAVSSKLGPGFETGPVADYLDNLAIESIIAQSRNVMY